MVQRSLSANAGMQSPGGWRRVGEPSSAGVNPGWNWRQTGAAPNRTNESIRINPPIVRERTTPQSVVYRGSASRPAASAPRTNSSGGGSHTPSRATSRGGDAHRRSRRPVPPSARWGRPVFERGSEAIIGQSPSCRRTSRNPRYTSRLWFAIHRRMALNATLGRMALHALLCRQTTHPYSRLST